MKRIAIAGLTKVLLLAAAASIGGESIPAILPSGFGEAVDRDVARLREATAAFQSSARAVAAGYRQTDHCVEKPPEGGMGYHFDNPALRDGVLELEKPETLVYEKRPDGTFKLNGVEYIVPLSAWKSTEPPTIMGQNLKRADSLGFWYLHVWNWEQSPTGLFADWNPRVKCPKPAM
jgi:hypothetical protein